MNRSFPTLLMLGWAAMSISVVGDELVHYVYFVSAVTGEQEISIGAIGFAIGVSSLAGGPIGAWLNRCQQRLHVILPVAVLASAFVAILLWLVWTSLLMVPLTYVSCFVLSVLGLVTTIVWQTVLPDLAAGDQDLLKRVMGWTAVTLGAGVAVGSLLAGTLVPVLGARQVILLDAASFLLAVALFVPLNRQLRQQADSRARIVDNEAPKRKTRGMRLVLAAPLVRGPAISLALMNIVAFAAIFAVPLLVAQRQLPIIDIALATASATIASLLGSVLGTYLRQERMFLRYLVWEPAVRAAGVLILACAHSTVTLLVGVVILNLPQGMGRVSRLAYLAASFQREDRAAALGAYRMLVSGAMPIAPLLMQPLVTGLGAATFFLGTAVLLVGVSVCLCADTELRDAVSLRRNAEVTPAGQS